MDVWHVPPAILAHSVGQNLIMTPYKCSALKYVVMVNAFLWPVMMATTLMETVALKIVSSNLDSTVLVAHPTLPTSALLSSLPQSYSHNQDKPTSSIRSF